MQRFVIRHAASTGNRLTRFAFGKDGSPLSELGKQQALELRPVLGSRGIDVTTEHVAVSPKTRAQDTAWIAGFQHLSIYMVLDEVMTGLKHGEAGKMLAAGLMPSEATKAARAILSNPPPERVWVTHGLVLAALLHELGIKNSTPDLCSITELDI